MYKKRTWPASTKAFFPFFSKMLKNCLSSKSSHISLCQSLVAQIIKCQFFTLKTALQMSP